MVKLISFIVLTHFFQFNELKILRQPGYLLKVTINILQYKLNHQYFFTVCIYCILDVFFRIDICLLE